jgi:hypothetical protein
MTETGWAGWVEAHELPASEQLRSVAEILNQPMTAAERRQVKREQAEEAERLASARDAADVAATEAFRARMTGRPPRNPLADAAAEPFRDHEAAARRRAAIDALRPLGLADVITGGASGCVLDVNLGILEPAPDVAERARMDRQYEAARSEREVEERNRAVEQFRVNLDERRRARGWDRPASSRSANRQRAADSERRQYERACAEIGERPVSYR